MAYNPFTASVTPVGMVVVPTSAPAPNTVTVDSSARLREGNTATNTNGTYFTCAVFPEKMVDGAYTVGVGNAAISTSDRGIGAGYSNNDHSRIIFFIMSGNTTACRLYTYIDGILTPVGTTQSIFSTAGSDVLWIRYSVSGSDIIYTVYRNATATTVTWTDVGGATLGTPGRKPVAAFRRTYSGSQFASPGIDSIEAAML